MTIGFKRTAPNWKKKQKLGELRERRKGYTSFLPAGLDSESTLSPRALIYIIPVPGIPEHYLLAKEYQERCCLPRGSGRRDEN